MTPVYFWLILMIVFIVFELVTMGLTTIWFALGSLVALAVAAVGGPVWLQILVFVIVSIATLFTDLSAVSLRVFSVEIP